MAQNSAKTGDILIIKKTPKTLDTQGFSAFFVAALKNGAVAGVAGFEPATECVKIVDTSTFLRNADLHLTCIFVFISKLSFMSTPYLAPYLARISAKISGAEKSKSGADI